MKMTEPSDKLFDIFERVTDDDRNGGLAVRIKRIRKRSVKQYVDDGPYALASALSTLVAKEHWSTARDALVEVERLYDIEDSSNYLTIWEVQPPVESKKQKRRKGR